MNADRQTVGRRSGITRSTPGSWPLKLPAGWSVSALICVHLRFSSSVARALLVVLLTAWVGSGCSSAGSGGGSSRSGAASKAGSSSDATSSETVNRLDERVQGKVIDANPGLRFVVMDFPLRRRPALEQRLNVYREGQKVGEVKVSGPAIDTTIAGDVMVGEARVGDEVRED